MHSIITSEGQTTIPVEIRTALNMKSGDRIVYILDGNEVRMAVHGGVAKLGGVLASKEGQNLSFEQIRQKAAQKAFQCKPEFWSNDEGS